MFCALRSRRRCHLAPWDQVVCSRSLSITFARDTSRPLVVSRGADQVPMSSRFSRRGDAGVTRNYGRLLEDLVASVPPSATNDNRPRLKAWKKLV